MRFVVTTAPSREQLKPSKIETRGIESGDYRSRIAFQTLVLQ